MLERETLRIAAQRGQPGSRLIRGALWAMILLILLTLLVFYLVPETPSHRLSLY